MDSENTSEYDVSTLVFLDLDTEPQHEKRHEKRCHNPCFLGFRQIIAKAIAVPEDIASQSLFSWT